MVADIATAFVLLVAGGCARVLGRHAWFWLGEIWQAHVYVCRKLAAAAKPKEEVAYRHYEERCSCQYCNWVRGRMSAAYKGTKNAGKVPLIDAPNVREAEERLNKALQEDDEVWMKIAMQSGASRSEAEKRVKKFHAMRNNFPRRGE